MLDHDQRHAAPIAAAVIAGRLDAIAEHMAEAMMRTSRSPMFQLRDLVTGIFTGDGRWVTTKDYIPLLAGSMPSAVKAVRERFASDDIHDGDVFLLNDPYHGNNHPPDLTVIAPMFHGQDLAFWLVSKGHHIDVGGGGVGGYNPMATTCWEDGVRIPPVRIVDRGRIVRDIWALILLNVRLPDMVEGDLHCQLGAVHLGIRDLRGLLVRFGMLEVRSAIDYRLRATQRHLAAEIAAMRDGSYRAERFLDGGGAHVPGPIRVAVEVRIEGDRMTLDFDGSDPQVEGYANSPYANTVAACLIALFAMFDVDRNSGSMDLLRVVAAPGTIVNPLAPAATTLCTLQTSETVVEAVWLALSQVIPERTPAAWGRAHALGETGIDHRTGRGFLVGSSLIAAGGGASFGCDGRDGIGSVVAMGGMFTADPELSELQGPVRVLSIAALPDSAGAGQWRGGVGARVRYRIEQDDVVSLCLGGGATERTAPFGLLGGLGGAPSRCIVERADGSSEPAPPNTLRTVQTGDVMVSEIAGGGGYGDPVRRDRDSVKADLRAGLISPEAARDVYGLHESASGNAASSSGENSLSR